MVNYSASIGHDSVVSRLCVIGPGAAVAGGCHLEEAAYLGAGAMVRERLRVGADSVTGMGAVVTRDVSAHRVALGVPARFKSKQDSGTGWLK